MPILRQSPSTSFKACSYSVGRGVSPSNAFSCMRASIKLLRKHSYPVLNIRNLAMGLIPRPPWAQYRTAPSSLACKKHGKRFKRLRLRSSIKGKFHRRVQACFFPSRFWTIRLRKRPTYSEKTLDHCGRFSSTRNSTKQSGWPTGPHMALEPPYGVQILRHWMLLHVGLTPGRYGSINTSMSIPTFHSVVIRTQGLALNSAKMGSKNSAMCRSLRTDDEAGSAVAE